MKMHSVAERQTAFLLSLGPRLNTRPLIGAGTIHPIMLFINHAVQRLKLQRWKNEAVSWRSTHSEITCGIEQHGGPVAGLSASVSSVAWESFRGLTHEESVITLHCCKYWNNVNQYLHYIAASIAATWLCQTNSHCRRYCDSSVTVSSNL